MTLRPVSYLYILILQCLHIEPDGGYRLDGLVGLVLEAVQDGRLSGIVEAEDEYSHFLRPEQALEEPAHQNSHSCGGFEVMGANTSEKSGRCVGVG